MFIADENYYYKVLLIANKEDVENIIQEDIKEQCYIEYEIPKKNGTRKIYAIDKQSELYRLQRNLQSSFLCKIPLPNAAKGFVKKEGYTTYLSTHTNKSYYLRIDISSFFDSITIEQLDKSLKEFISVKEVRDNIINICTLNEKLPQGGVTSPSLSNIIFRRLDQRITKYCRCFDVSYTRYADDMFFSSDNLNFIEKKFFYNKINKLLNENGFSCNKSKTIVTSNKISLSGYVIGEDIHLSRKKLYNINKIIYFFKEHKEFTNKKYSVDKSIIKSSNFLEDINKLNITRKNGATKRFDNTDQLIDFLCGYRSFIISVLTSNKKNTQFTKQMTNKINYIELIIDNLIV